MRVLCYKCDHSWNYKGKNTEGKGYITCSGCYYKIRLDRAIVKGLPEQKLLTKLPSFQRELPKELSKIPTTHYPKIDLKPLEIKRPIKIIEDVEEEEVEQVEEIFIDGKACELHRLPATYDSFEMKWVCEKCLEFEIPNAKPYENNLGIVRYIQTEKSIKVIPIDPLRALKNQMNF